MSHQRRQVADHGSDVSGFYIGEAPSPNALPGDILDSHEVGVVCEEGLRGGVEEVLRLSEASQEA